MNILIADDEIQMVKILSAYFKKEGFTVFEAADGEQALAIFESVKIDIAVVDWMTPLVDGIHVCKYIKNNSGTKVLILTAKSQTEDELEALQTGADEYIRKPFDPRILIARVRKLLCLGEEIQANSITVNVSSKKAFMGDAPLHLTKIEYELLFALTSNMGNILSRDKLIDLVWGMDYDGDYRTVDTHIRRLRRKIGDDFIKTYRGIGYCMEVKENKDQK